MVVTLDKKKPLEHVFVFCHGPYSHTKLALCQKVQNLYTKHYKCVSLNKDL